MGEYLTSRQNPLIARIRKLAGDRAFRRAEGCFLCDGVKLVDEALRRNATIEVLMTAEGVTLPFSCPPGVREVTVPADLMACISTVACSQGVLALCRAPCLTPPCTLAPGRFLVLDGLQDPGNVGTIWRTADALGADGLFLLGHCADPLAPKTVRATMGAAFRLPLWETDWQTLCPLLAAAGIPLYATALREDTEDVRTVALSPSAVIIGSEGSGVSAQGLAYCARTLKIPMTARCESLNAAVAATIVLWEMARYSHLGCV